MAKIMVVDDAYSELKLMEGILKSAGLEVVTSLDGDKLEDKLVTERPDLLLLDIVMPNRNGYELLRSIKRDARGTCPSCSSAPRTRIAIASGGSARAPTNTSASPSLPSSS
jgi:CheY-like chemotaxis protein